MVHERRNKVEAIRAAYKPGIRLRLIKMEDEPGMPSGLEGTVDHVDDIGQVHMRWENGSTLAIAPDIDSFQIIGGI